jgi:tetratricopeptide (TPR) repeat protein
VIEAKGPDRIRLADAFDGRCSAYNQKQQYRPALSDCKSAIDLNPKYSYAYANLGSTYLGLNDSSNALSALNKAVALKSNFLWSRLSRAKALEASGSNEDAVKDYEYALLIDPANQQASEGVARLIAPSSSAQPPEFCVRDANEQAQYIAVSAAGSSATGIEGAISTISSTAQTYKTKLNSVIAKIDDLNREKDTSDRKRALIIGSTDERKRAINDVQRLTEAASESHAKVDSISEKVSEQESKLAAAEASNTGRTKEKQERLKELRQEVTKLRANRAEAEHDLHRKVSELDDAVSTAQRTALQIAEAVSDVQRLVAAKDAAESCATGIRASIEAFDQKADELRQKRDAEAARVLQVNTDHLMADLSEFAQRNSNLVPLEVGPLVAALKGSLAAKDFEKSSNAFATLQARLEQVPEFRRFRTSREEVRNEAAKAELDELTDTARAISEFIESFVRRNITSDIAQDLLKLRGAVSEALVTPEPEALKLVIFKSEREFDRLSVLAEYHDYRAKHPRQSRRSLPATTDRNRPLVEGPLDETLILVNESGRAGVVRNLRGDLVFDGGKASLCLPYDNTSDAFTMSEIKLKVRERGARTVEVSSAPCNADNLDDYDTIAVNRGLFGTIAPDTAAVLLSAVDKGELSIMGSVSDRDLQIKRNGESIKSLQLENDVLKKAVEGYGLVAIGNGTSVICQTSTDREKAHEALVARSFDRLQVELGPSPKVISTSIDSAFVSAKRGQCGAIYGSSRELRDLITSLQRDKLNYHVLPIWFSPADIDAEQNAIAARVTQELRQQQAIEQKRQDDEVRAEIEKKQTDAERIKREEKLRKENGVPARGLEDSIFAEVKAFATKSEYEDKTHVGQEWPALATWYRGKIREQWELENVASELRDYGVVEWKNRVLEAGFVAITFKIKHRLLGEHQQKCFIVGYVSDREFEVERDPIAVTCENDGAINGYKRARKFSSKWFAN